MTGARRVLRVLQTLVPRSDSGLYILAYHLVGAGTSSPVDLDLETFRGQVLELRERTQVAWLETAVEALGRGSRGDRLTVVVTFDDAYENFLSHAWPILEELRVPAMLYVPTGFVNGYAPAPIRGTAHLPPISWTQLRELQRTGLLAIGSHTRSHPNLCRLDTSRAWREVAESKDELEQRLGSAVTSFCYPGAHWSRRIERLVARVYDSAVVAGGRRIDRTKRRLTRLSRLPLRRDMPASLTPVLGHAVWLEESVAAVARRWLR